MLWRRCKEEKASAPVVTVAFSSGKQGGLYVTSKKFDDYSPER